MPASGADLYGFQPFASVGGAGGVAHTSGHRILVISPADGAIAELADVVESPGVHVSVTAQGQRILVSGADLHVGEILWQVRIRRAIRHLHHDRLILVGFRPVAELA